MIPPGVKFGSLEINQLLKPTIWVPLPCNKCFTAIFAASCAGMGLLELYALVFSMAWVLNSVATGPGQIAFTSTPVPSNSAAKVSVNARQKLLWRSTRNSMEMADKKAVKLHSSPYPYPLSSYRPETNERAPSAS